MVFVMKVPIEEFTKHYSYYTNLVCKKYEEIIVTKKGKPIAKLIPPEGGMRPTFKCVIDTSIPHEKKEDPMDIKWKLPNHLPWYL